MNPTEIDEIFALANLVHKDYQSLKADLEKTRAEIKRQKEQLSKLYALLR